MAGIQNKIIFGEGFKLQASSAASISNMQELSTDVSRINHTGNPEGVVSANPSSLCHDPVSGSVYIKNSGTGNTGWQLIVLGQTDLHTARYIVGDITKGANYSDASVAYAAAVAATAPQTVFLQDGTHTVNIQAVSGINISSFGSGGSNNVQGSGGSPNVILKGTLTSPTTGMMAVAGIQLRTNGAAAIAVAGSGSSSINFVNSSVQAQDAVGMTFANASCALNFYGCTFGNASTNAIFQDVSGISGIDFENCVWSTNGTAAASTLTTGRAVFQGCDLHGVNIAASGTGGVFVNACYWQYGGQTLLATSGTGTSEIYNSYLRCDNATAITIGSGTTVNMANCQILSTATNALSGAGTLNHANITYISSRGNTVSTQNAYAVGKIYSPVGITFDNTNVMANYVDKGTFTPTLIGGSTAGTTTYSGQVGYYTRIGNLVFVTLDITISAATGTGAITIGNLPFTINSQSNGYVNGACFWQGGTLWTWPAGATSVSALGLPNTTTALIWGAGSGIAGGFVSMANQALQVSISLVYQI